MRKIIFFTVIILCTLSIVNSIRSMYSLWKKQDLLVKTRLELQKEQQENSSLKKQLQVVSTQDFVEEEARNKLFLVKPGESTVIIPKDLLSPTVTPVQVQKQQTNWEQWWNLFF